MGTEPDIVTRGLEDDLDKKIVIDEINRLEPRDREIMILRYGLLGSDEYTQKEVIPMPIEATCLGNIKIQRKEGKTK